jgi:putative endonuclease
MLIFVEVNSRATREQALESVTPGLRQRLEQAARIWVSSRHKLQNHLWRFDIVLMTPGRLPCHIRNAWQAGNEFMGHSDRLAKPAKRPKFAASCG